jgi:uncharacterized protein YfaT (DUF1175 family)
VKSPRRLLSKRIREALILVALVRPFVSLVIATAILASPAAAQVRLADESDRAAFRSWFVLLADAQFDQPASEVTDCAALIRFAFREALRAHTPEWTRRLALPFAPQFPDVRSAPKPGPEGWPLFRVSESWPPRYAEFADARTIVSQNATLIGRDPASARPGDLLYFRQPGQSQPDHLMVVVGRSFFEPDGDDWVVYHTGPSDDGPGEVRKVRLETLARHPSARWRPSATNTHFVGVFRLAALHTS